MLWTDLFYMIVITTFTGSVLTVAWLITSYLLDKTGYLNMSYRLGKVVVLFWIIPVMYYAIRMIDRLRFVWNGYAFDTSPLIINVTRAVAIVWITGLAVAIMIYVFKRFRILSIRKESFACNKEMNRIFYEIKEQMGLGKCKITLRQSYRTTTAYVTGIHRPCVVVNADYFSEKEMRVVFAHELTHVVHNDIWFRYLLAVASILNFFNPVIWIFYRRFIKYAEYACDFSVCMSENGLHEYYETIFNIAVRNNNLYDILSASLYENKNSLRERMEHVMKSYNVKKRPMAVAAAILTLFVAMSSVMVAGAATTVTETSVTVAEVTADEKRELQVLETEYYEAADYEDSAVTDMYEEDVNPDEIMPCASNGTISWDVYAGVRRSTSSFHASSGQRIVLSVFSVEPFHSVRAGIIQPDGSKRYIIANGNDSHVFELTMSGSYRIYIQNETTEMVHVEGAYSTH